MSERIVFMGTPEFGAGILKCLLEEKYNVVLAVTQPDKLVGRKQVLTFPPVKTLALENGVEVFQPEKIRNDYQPVLDAKPDLIVTCAYGQLIPQQVLDCALTINVHPSLLPKLRGGAPLQRAVMNGFEVSGVTIMELVKKMDAGDMIVQKEYVLKKNETYGSIHDTLLQMSCELLKESMPAILSHSYTPIPQNEEEVTFGYNIAKEEEKIDFSKSYKEISCQIRGLSPEPCAYFMVDGKKVKLWDVEESDQHCEKPNGTIVFVGKKLGVVIDETVLVIHALQLEGKGKMSSKEFRNGAGRSWEGKIAE